MRRTPESKIKEAFLHPQEAIRLYALTYYSEARCEDASIMPLVIRSAEKFGREMAWQVLFDAPGVATERGHCRLGRQRTLAGARFAQRPQWLALLASWAPWQAGQYMVSCLFFPCPMRFPMTSASIPNCPWRKETFCLRRARELLVASGELAAHGSDGALEVELKPWLPRILRGDIDAPCRLLTEGQCKSRPETPRYDPVRRELWVGDECVLRLSVWQVKEHAILKAFQASGWPERISFDDVRDQETGSAN